MLQGVVRVARIALPSFVSPAANVSIVGMPHLPASASQASSSAQAATASVWLPAWRYCMDQQSGPERLSSNFSKILSA